MQKSAADLHGVCLFDAYVGVEGRDDDVCVH